MTDQHADQQEQPFDEFMAEMDKRASAETQRLCREIRRLQAENASLKDRPEHDGTDYAHAAWWRGHDDGVGSAARLILETLERGEYFGVCNSESLQKARTDVAALVAENASLRERVEELETARNAALAVLPRKRNPDPDDAKQKLVNLAGGLLED